MKLEELNKLKELYLTKPDLPAFYYSLDGGGREILFDSIKKSKILVEIGSFVGGSTIQWCEINPKISIISVDSGFSGKWGWEYIKQNWNPAYTRGQKFEVPEGHTLLDYFLNNTFKYKDRIIPVDRNGIEFLHELIETGIRPCMFYIDASKDLPELEIISDLFPEATISGDDWTWGSNEHRKNFQKKIYNHANKLGKQVLHDRATWIIK
jgi:hypothetical protein